MNLNYLECFASLAETLSFTATAKHFSISQPAVSRQIKLLEQQLGTRLFVRDKHKVMLSREGQKLKNQLNPLLTEIHGLLRGLHNEGETLKACLRFASLGEVGQNFLHKILLDFINLNPQIDLRLTYLSPTEIIEQVKNARVDFGLVNERISLENVKSFELLKERAGLVCGNKNQEDWTDTKSASFVCYAEDDQLLSSFLQKHHKKTSPSKIKQRVVVNSHRSMIDALQATNSFAVLPFFSVESALKEKRLKLASDKEIHSSLYLLYLDNPWMPKAQKLLKQYLLERCRKQKI